MRRLRFTTGSPFARAVRIVLHEKGLDYDRIEEITTTSIEERLMDGPTLQVPAFADGDIRLWDSGVIIDYLMAKYPNGSASPGEQPFADVVIRAGSEIQDKLLIATLQTLGSSITTVSQFQWSGIKIGDNAYLARNAERVEHILDWLEPRLDSEAEGFFPGAVSVQDVLLAVFIMFAEKRPIDIDWRSRNRPRIEALHDRLAARQSFTANPIWWWEPGVTGYEPDGTPIYGG